MEEKKSDQLLIGTSGYDYPEWKGKFYPENLRRKDFLLYYSTVFNALEINSTFYNMPTAERLISFYERSEGRVQLSIKGNRLLTHEIAPAWKNCAEEFKKAITPLSQKGKLSAVLFQFPQSFRYTDQNRIYLANLITAFEGFPVVIEFRHTEWIRESVFEGLEKRKTGIVYCDMPNLKSLPKSIAELEGTTAAQFTGPNAYIRLHGRNEKAWYASGNTPNGSGRYLYDYSDEELKTFVPVVRTAMSKAKRVHIFFNNHPDGSGAKNAKRFSEMMRGIKL